MRGRDEAGASRWCGERAGGRELDAVGDGTQLILLGDADQLPSVEAGDVLAAILQAAGPGDALQPE
ncbi:AAA family ATPase, partial [Xanthomonas perforans]